MHENFGICLKFLVEDFGISQCITIEDFGNLFEISFEVQENIAIFAHIMTIEYGGKNI